MSEPHERLQRARVAKGYATAGDAAEALGINPVTYRSHENGIRGFTREAARYAAFFGVDLAWLLTGAGEAPLLPEHPPQPRRSEVRPADARLPGLLEMPRNVPVLGTVAGATLGKGAFQMTSDVIEYVRRPPGLAGVGDAYALYVENESMVPEFRPGHIVYVHPRRPPEIGGAVVVQEKAESGEVAGYIKILKARTPAYIVTEQHNPRAEVRFNRSRVIALHRVLTMAELLGI